MTKLATTFTLTALLMAPAAAQAQLAAGEPAMNLQLTDWLPGVNNVTDIAFLADKRAVITRKTGQVAVVALDGTVIKPNAVVMTVDATNEKGLLGVVVDPQDNIYFYASTGNDNLNKHKVYKARAAADGTITVDLDNPVVTGGLEGPANHDGGGMYIHKGQLYVGVGDTGANATPPQNKYSACLNKPNGKILRVNLDGTIPADNPLSALDMVTGCATVTGAFMMAPPDKRVFAWGLRNPWRFWIDAETDLLWIGDVGETTEEEITVGGKGVSHGYPFREGSVKYPAGLGGITDCMGMTPPVPCTDPQDRYIHQVNPPPAARTQSSVTGGLVPPKGCGWGPFETRYVFGDYNRNVLWTLDLKPDRTGAVANSRKDLAANVSSPVTFRLGPDGAIYIAANSEGSIKRLAPKSIPATCLAAQAPGDGGAGGAPGDGGVDAAGGKGGTGGGPTGGSAGSGTGGRGGTGGSSSDGAAAASGGDDDDGCSCSLGDREGTPAGAGLVLAGLALLATRWRRRPRR
jgi:glucose/arabinose dehydrogenase